MLRSMGHRCGYKHLTSVWQHWESPATLVSEIKNLKVINGRWYGKCNSKAVPIYWERKLYFFYGSRGRMPWIQKGRTLPMSMSSELAPKQKLLRPSVIESGATACKDVISSIRVFFFSDYRLQMQIRFTITCCCSKYQCLFCIF